MALARETKTALQLREQDVGLYSNKGSLVDYSSALRLQKLLWDIFKEPFAYSVDHGSEISVADSLHDFVRQRLAELEILDEDRDTLEQMSRSWDNYIGESILKQSLKYVWTESVCAEGTRVFMFQL